MKLNRTTIWLVATIAPFLMSVRTQRTTPHGSNTRQVATCTSPASMVVHQQVLADRLWVMLQQTAAQEKGSQPAGGCLYGTGNITLPMTHIVKE